jgi:hypothetical protein
MTREQQREQAGFMLLAAITFLACTLTVIQVSLGRVVIERSAAQLYVTKQQAFHLAESGVDLMLAEFQKAPNERFSGWTEINAQPICQTQLGGPPCWQGSLFGNQIDIQVGGLNSDLAKALVSARMADTTEQLEVEIGLNDGLLGRFPLAILSTGNTSTGIRLGARVRIDSYDSRLGAYDAVIGGSGWTRNRSDDRVDASNQPIGDPSTWKGHLWSNSNSVSNGQEAIRLAACASAGASNCQIWGSALIGQDLAGPQNAITNPNRIHGTIQSPQESAVTQPVTLPAGAPCPACPVVGGGVISVAELAQTSGVIPPPSSLNGQELVWSQGGELAWYESLYYQNTGDRPMGENFPHCGGTPGVEMENWHTCSGSGGELTITGSGTVHFDGGNFAPLGLSIDGGNVTLVLHNSMTLTDHVRVYNGATLQIYTDGDSAISGHINALVGDGTDGPRTPSKVVINVAGNHTVHLVTQYFSGVLNAPDSHVLVDYPYASSLDFFGSITARLIEMDPWGNIFLHYDQALGAIGSSDTGNSKPVLRLWRYY